MKLHFFISLMNASLKMRDIGVAALIAVQCYYYPDAYDIKKEEQIRAAFN